MNISLSKYILLTKFIAWIHNLPLVSIFNSLICYRKAEMRIYTICFATSYPLILSWKLKNPHLINSKLNSKENRLDITNKNSNLSDLNPQSHIRKLLYNKSPHYQPTHKPTYTLNLQSILPLKTSNITVVSHGKWKRVTKIRFLERCPQSMYLA